MEKQICGIISNSGPNGEPLACGFMPDHPGNHSWAALPTFPFQFDRLIAERLKQHRENLAGWHEGKRCNCVGAAGGQGARPTCSLCRGTGIQAGTSGRLVPTEPDPEEREMIRRDLKVAICELEQLQRAI
jgi:hypothetical protein